MDVALFDILEVLGRTSVIYLFIILGLRLFGKSELAQLSTVDFVFILLISNAVQNAMVGSNTSVWGGIAAAGTLFVLNFGWKKMVVYFPKVKEWVEGEPITLIYKGKLLHSNLSKAKILPEEIAAVVREHGYAEISEVDLAVLETDGNISVLAHSFENQKISTRKRHKRNKIPRLRI